MKTGWGNVSSIIFLAENSRRIQKVRRHKFEALFQRNYLQPSRFHRSTSSRWFNSVCLFPYIRHGRFFDLSHSIVNFERTKKRFHRDSFSDKIECVDYLRRSCLLWIASRITCNWSNLHRIVTNGFESINMSEINRWCNTLFVHGNGFSCSWESNREDNLIKYLPHLV